MSGAILLAILAGPARAGQDPAADSTFAITHVTLIDGTGAPATSDMTVVVRGRRIATIGPAATVLVPSGTRVIDGRGRYLIPGLWDMHTHMATASLPPYNTGSERVENNWRFFFPLLVAYGVTGVRDMAGELDMLVEWREAVRRGDVIGPRMVVTGWKLGSRAVVEGAPFPIRTVEDVRTSIHLLREHNADFVKVDEVSTELFRSLEEESRRFGFNFVGHVPLTVNPGQASDMGMRSIEHLAGILLACAAEGETLRREMMEEPSLWERFLDRVHLSSPDRRQRKMQREILDTYDSAKAAALIRVFQNNGTWQVPTLVMLRDIKRVPAPETDQPWRAAFTPPHRAVLHETFFVGDSALAARTFEAEMAMVRQMHEAGIPILAGTDSPGIARLPGVSLGDELALLVHAGLSPMAALQSATSEPARFLGTSDSLGTVEEGKLADLVLLEADPLVDIRNVHRVYGVFLDGRYLPRPVLDQMLNGVRQLVAGWKSGAR